MNKNLTELAFAHRYILAGKKYWYLSRAAVILLGNVLHDCMATYLPAYAVELIVARDKGIFLQIAIYTLAMSLLGIVVKRVESTTNKTVDNARMVKAQEYYIALCQTDYENLDSAGFKTKYEAGQTSFYDGFHSGFHHMILDFRILLQSVVGLAVYCGLAARVDLRIALIQVALSAVTLWLTAAQRRWMANHQEKWEALEVKLAYLNRASGDLQNAKDIRLYRLKPWLLGKWDNLTKARLTWEKRELTYGFLVKAAGRVLQAGKYLAVYLLVLAQVRNGLPVDEFVFLVSLALGINNWVEKIFHQIQYLQMNGLHVNNTRRVLEDCAVKAGQSRPALQGDGTAPEIRLEDVSFTFPEGKTPIFSHFNLTIHPGEKLAVVGNNGAGKTTLIKLICGLYRPTAGRLLINGVDTAKLTPEEIYAWCTVAFQDFHLLAATLAENVSCQPEDQTDTTRVQSCLDQVGLGQKVRALPDGLDTQMTKELYAGGVIFSGGETQRLMIARCLYQNRPIFILDEPTAALDALAEREIYQKYHQLTKGKTSIFISHRLSSTQFCDRIILLRDGQIAEEGTHAQLLAKGGAYTKMYATQASYYQEGSRNGET